MNINTGIRVYQTDELDKFKLDERNRSTTPNHVKELMDSMKENGVIKAPIIVNEKFIVLDGQHRLEACKRLNLPIYYMVIDGYGMKEAVQMNANLRRWVLNDYIEYFAADGNADYVFLKRMLEKYKVSPRVAAAVLMDKQRGGGGTSTDRTIKKGDFQCSVTEGEAIKTFEFIRDALEHYKIRTSGNITYVQIGLAFIIRFCDPDVERSFKVMSKLAQLYPYGFVSTSVFMKAFSETYDKGLGAKNKKKFARAYEDRGQDDQT